MSLPPALPDASARDADHLRLLALFHALFGLLALLGLGLVYLHYHFMSAFFSPALLQQQKNPPPAAFFDMFIWLYVFFAAMCVVMCALNLLAAYGLYQRRWRTFCMVVAGLDCAQVPLGTVLGVFTLVTLSRDSVREQFHRP